MLLKSADDKSKRLALLEDLQRSSMLDARQKKWLREELSRLRKGIEGERESAYFLASRATGMSASCGVCWNGWRSAPAPGERWTSTT